MIKKYSFFFILLIVTIVPLFTSAQDIKITDPLGLSASGADAPYVLYGRLIKGFTGVMGAIALFFFIMGGFKWLTSGGNEEKVRKGKDTLVWATLGLTVILSSYIILSYVIATLTTTVTGG